jgi:hypothetical protein
MSKDEKSGIFVTIRFWTDFSKENGTLGIIPKQAWAAGAIYLRASDMHGIKSGSPVMFNNLEELMVKLDRLLREQGITLVVQDDRGNYMPRLGKSYPKWTWKGA